MPSRLEATAPANALGRPGMSSQNTNRMNTNPAMCTDRGGVYRTKTAGMGDTAPGSTLPSTNTKENFMA